MASPSEPAQYSGPGGDPDILRERDRIAADLQNEVIQQVFTIGLNLQSTAAITIDPLVRRRIEQAIDDLDHLIHTIRDTVFDLETGLKDRGLRAGILHLCEQLSPTPDVTFRGPVDGALHPTATAELLDILAAALAATHDHWAPVAIDITAANGTHVTTLHAMPLPGATAAAEPAQEFSGLLDRAAQAGMRIEIEPGPKRVQITWHAA